MKRFIRKSGHKIVPAAIALLMVLFFCFSAGAQTPTPTSSPTQPSAPAITSISLSISPPASPLASPAANTTYADVQVSIQVAGLNLVDKIGQANAPGEGHIIYYLTDPATFPLLKAYTASGTYFPMTSTTFTRSNYNYTRGKYWVFAAQLVNNNDTPLNPPVYAEIVTNLPAPGEAATQPAITSFSLSTRTPETPPASPVPNATYMDVTLNPEISGFNIKEWTGDTAPPNVAGEGHYMYCWYIDPLTVPAWNAYVDDFYSYSRTAAPFTFTNVFAGYKSFSVQLVTNDSSPLDPPVYAIVKSNLEPGLGTPPPSATATPTTISPVPSVLPSPSPSTSNGGVP